jgi:probable rRNA maturation factor
VLVNLQKLYSVHSASLLAFARSLKRRLRLGKQEFNICLVDDDAIRRLNSAYRGKDKSTDVLSFPWNETDGPQRPQPRPASRRGEIDEFRNFLGDVVISVETARRSAAAEGHATVNEIRWLILHGVLHLLGYDHERDAGEMIELEMSVREQLGVGGGTGGKRKIETRKSKLENRESKVENRESETESRKSNLPRRRD